MNISGPPSNSATPGTRSPANITQNPSSVRPMVVKASRSGSRTSRERMAAAKHAKEKPRAKKKARSAAKPASMSRPASGASPSPTAAERHPGFAGGSGKSRMARTMLSWLTRQDEKVTVANVSTTPIE